MEVHFCKYADIVNYFVHVKRGWGCWRTATDCAMRAVGEAQNHPRDFHPSPQALHFFRQQSVHQFRTLYTVLRPLEIHLSAIAPECRMPGGQLLLGCVWADSRLPGQTVVCPVQVMCLVDYIHHLVKKQRSFLSGVWQRLGDEWPVSPVSTLGQLAAGRNRLQFHGPVQRIYFSTGVPHLRQLKSEFDDERKLFRFFPDRSLSCTGKWLGGDPNVLIDVLPSLACVCVVTAK